LRRAADAIVIDTSDISFEQQCERILSVVRAGI
jgi:cytidylate kinase